MFNKIFRFFQIDLQYFFLPLPFFDKLSNILATDFSLISNILMGRKKTFPKVRFNNVDIVYDTPFSTKTFLAAIYDFYIETQRNSILSGKVTIVDVGANIGQYLTAVKNFLPNAHVICFEPDSEICELLEQNAAKYKNVKVHNYALSDREGLEKFYVSLNFSEWSSLTKSAISGESREVKVKTVIGDKILSSIEHIDLLKIDVEGAEFKVVKGLAKSLKKTNYLLIETSILRNSEDPGSRKLLSFLFDQGFYIYSIGRIFSAGVGKEQGAVDILFKNRNFD